VEVLEIAGYEIAKKIEGPTDVDLYIGHKQDEEVLIKVAKGSAGEAHLFDELKRFNQIRAFLPEAKRLRPPDGGPCPLYDNLFAQLIDTFLVPGDDLRVNVFRLGESKMCDLTPLSELRKVEIDIRTGAWILERLFMVYEFYELLAEDGDIPVISYPKFSENDYLVDPRNQRLLYYNFSGPATDLTGDKLIRKVVKSFRKWIVDTGEASEMKSLLADLESCGAIFFDQAYTKLSGLAYQLWGDQYYPFTYREPGSKTWRTLGPKK